MMRNLLRSSGIVVTFFQNVKMLLLPEKTHCDNLKTVVMELETGVVTQTNR